MPDRAKPTLVVCAIIERKGLVLLAQRPAHKHLGGKWEFPGGKIESGESPAEAIVREIHEELGCEFVPRAELPRCLHHYDKITIEMIPIAGAFSHPSAKIVCHEHSAVAWSQPEELRAYDLAPADYPVLENYLNTLRRHD
jgi:8-oxo-dGTP diphosphatase